MLIDLGKDAGLLAALAGEVRAKTLRLLDDVKDSELMYSPPGLSNHILWYAGHMLWVQDALGIAAVTCKSELPPAWAESFGKFCRPVKETQHWPGRNEIHDRLVAQLPRLQEIIGAVSRHDLEAPSPNKTLGTEKPLWYWITHASHDEANHQGEIYLLMKMQRKK